MFSRTVEKDQIYLRNLFWSSEEQNTFSYKLLYCSIINLGKLPNHWDHVFIIRKKKIKLSLVSFSSKIPEPTLYYFFHKLKPYAGSSHTVQSNSIIHTYNYLSVVLCDVYTHYSFKHFILPFKTCMTMYLNQM